jgi:hypothetical protein
MDSTAPIQSLATELQRQLATKHDLIADTRKVSLGAVEADWEGFDPTETAMYVDLREGVEGYGMTKHAHGQLATHLGVPQKLYDRLLVKHPDLLHGLTNGLLSREPSKRLVRTMDGNVRAFLSDRYRPRDNWDLMEHLLPVLAAYPEVQFKKCDLTDTRMYVKTFLPGREWEITPKVGDVIRGGVIISNSEVGAGSLYIYPYTDRLICLNGMVHTDYGQRRIHVGGRIESSEEAYEIYSDETRQLDDAAFFAKCADTLRACLNDTVFDAIAAQMRDLSDIRVPGSPVDQVQVLAKRQGFVEDEQASILTHLVEGGSLTAWGYLNALTATARDLTDADRQTVLEVTAGKMLTDTAWLEELVRA